MRIFLFFMILTVITPTTSTAQVPLPLGLPIAGVADILVPKIEFSSIIKLIEAELNIALSITNLQINNATVSNALKAKFSGQIIALMALRG
jgi:hypothetical protein